MRCVLCNGILNEYSKTSNLDLPVNHCKNCNLYVSGNTKEDVIEKVLHTYRIFSQIFIPSRYIELVIGQMSVQCVIS